VCKYSKICQAYICARTQRAFCVTSNIRMRSQAVSLTALVIYLKIMQMEFTKIDRFEKYFNNHTTKCKIFQDWIFFSFDSKSSGKNSATTKVFRIFITEKSTSFVLPHPVRVQTHFTKTKSVGSRCLTLILLT